MPVPKLNEMFLPALRFIGDGKEYNRSELIDRLAQEFHVSEEEYALTLQNGQRCFDNLIDWVRANFTRYKITEKTPSGSFSITDKGIRLLKKNPPYLTVKLLQEFPDT